MRLKLLLNTYKTFLKIQYYDLIVNFFNFDINNIYNYD